jgi:hypothetical protein
VSRLLCEAEHDFGVHEILGTSERNHSNFHCVKSLPASDFRLLASARVDSRPEADIV